MSGFTRLAGSYRLHPGQTPGISGHRPVLGQGLLTRLLRGQSGETVERTLSALFTLCSHAHRRTARLVLNAARWPGQAALPEPPKLLLTLETARDHLRSIALDWPRQLVLLALPDRSDDGSNHLLALMESAQHAIKINSFDWLKACPLALSQTHLAPTWQEAEHALTQLRHWLEVSVLQQPPDDWLAQHCTPDALVQWCRNRSTDLPPAQFLAACHRQASALIPGARTLDVLDHHPQEQAAKLAELARLIVAQPDFAQFPAWCGQCLETGPWARLRHRRLEPGSAAANRPTDKPSAWVRLASRWLELIELANAPVTLGSPPPEQKAIAAPGIVANDMALPALLGPGKDRPAALSSGALKLGDGQAIAWCEMARGLLLHWVQLDTQGKVADYRVIAPTEWNFHPQGALSLAVSALPPQDTASACILGAAYDACVECSVISSGSK
ncbi:MAG TPA: nickel-dependent hydrogenase large subunit [Rhodoferax sp.]|nr:nickel-dependent hydrogenase large subunit [Rhodoferax sp.]